nr:hypothetical protein [Enterococcus innesii]
MKKVSAILLVVAAMFVLAGCEYDDNPSESRQDVVQTKSVGDKLVSINLHRLTLIIR